MPLWAACRMAQMGSLLSSVSLDVNVTKGASLPVVKHAPTSIRNVSKPTQTQSQPIPLFYLLWIFMWLSKILNITFSFAL